MDSAAFASVVARLTALEEKVADINAHSVRLDGHDREIFELRQLHKNTTLRLDALERGQTQILATLNSMGTTVAVVASDLQRVFNVLTPMAMRSEKQEQTMESVDRYLSQILERLKR